MTLERRPGILAVIAVALMMARCAEEPPAPAPVVRKPAPVKKNLVKRSAVLYYESDALRLAPESRDVELPPNDAEAMKPLLTALLAPAPEGSEPHPVPDGIEIRATYLLPDGTAIVDLGGPLFTGGWKAGSDAEVMLAYSIVQTLIDNLKSIRRVQIIVNGQAAETLAGHVSIDRPLHPIRSLVQNAPQPSPVTPAPTTPQTTTPAQ